MNTSELGTQYLVQDKSTPSHLIYEFAVPRSCYRYIVNIIHLHASHIPNLDLCRMTITECNQDANEQDVCVWSLVGVQSSIKIEAVFSWLIDVLSFTC